MLPAPLQTSCPSLETISILELFVEFRQCHNGPLSAQLYLLFTTSPSFQTPIGFQGRGWLSVFSTGQGVHWRGDLGEWNCAVPHPLILGLFSTLRYHLPPMEKGGEWKPEPCDPLHHYPYQSPGSQNRHCQGDTGEQGRKEPTESVLGSAVTSRGMKAGLGRCLCIQARFSLEAAASS